MSETNDRPFRSDPSFEDWTESETARIGPTETDIDRVFQVVFDLRPVDIQVYHELCEFGKATSDDLAAEISRDRSYINRALRSLCRKGLAKRRRQLLSNGGFRYHYIARPREDARELLGEELEEWARETRENLDEII